jgi:hypothetical protein
MSARIVAISDVLDSTFSAMYAKAILAGTHGISSVEYNKKKDKTAIDKFFVDHKIDPTKAIVTVEPHAKNVSIERAKEADALPEYLEAKKYVDILIKKLGSKAAVCFSIVMSLYRAILHSLIIRNNSRFN